MSNMKKLDIKLITLSFFFLITIFLGSTAIGKEFSIKNYWEEGGVLQFEDYYSIDRPGSISDLEVTSDGTYKYFGNISIENAIFNYSQTSRPHNYILAQFSTRLDPGFLSRVTNSFGPEDEVDINFTVSGGFIDFFVFNQSQYTLWEESTDPQQIAGLKLISTEIGASDTIIFTVEDEYYFVWFNNPSQNFNNSIDIHVRLDARITEKTEIGDIELDPTTLKTPDSVSIDDFGMDTSDWYLNDEISIEIDQRDVFFTIMLEDEIAVVYNNKTVEIPCWVLMKENYERIFIEEENIKVKGELYLWKSMYSGITLKSTTDLEFYDSDDTLYAIYFNKYTVISASKVLLVAKSSSIPASLIPAIIGFIVVTQYNRKKKK